MWEMPKKLEYFLVPEDERMRFVIQIGKGPKGRYRTKYTTNNARQAELFYKGINIGNGYKKRILEYGKVAVGADGKVWRDFS
jgi:hypothetical protein